MTVATFYATSTVSSTNWSNPFNAYGPPDGFLAATSTSGSLLYLGSLQSGGVALADVIPADATINSVTVGYRYTVTESRNTYAHEARLFDSGLTNLAYVQSSNESGATSGGGTGALEDVTGNLLSTVPSAATLRTNGVQLRATVSRTTGTRAFTYSVDTMWITVDWTAAVAPTGTLAATNADDSAAISGNVLSPITGALAVTDVADTVAMSGASVQNATGTLATTNADDTAALSGTSYQNATGTLAVAETADTAAMSGTHRENPSGAMAAVETADSAAISGAETIAGTLASTAANDTVALAGAEAMAGTLSVAEAADTVALAGNVKNPVTGTLAATETADVVSTSGNVQQPITGTLAATEAADVVSASGAELVSGTLAATNGGDTVTLSGAETIPGTASVTNANDTAAIAASEIIAGTLAVTAASDSVAITGGSGAPITGTIVVTESGDIAFLGGTCRNPVYVFCPPAHEEPMRTDMKPLAYFRLTYAASVVRVNGVLTAMRMPSAELVKAAGVEGIDYFRGGGEYTVSAATKAELESLGYTVRTE